MLSSKTYKYIKASSLLESVIAISIISICILVAFTIYLNVVKQNKSIEFYNAIHKVNLLTQEVIVAKNYDSDSYEFTGYTIDKKVEIDKEDHIVLLVFKIKTANREHVMKKIIPFNNE